MRLKILVLETIPGDAAAPAGISSLIAGAQQTFFAHKNRLWEGRAQVRWEEVEPHKLSKIAPII